jgi:hypothetical protein
MLDPEAGSGQPRADSRAALVAPNLRIGLFRFALLPAQAMEVPALNKGNMLRGGFGYAFRRLCCVPQCRDTNHCPVADSCPYKAVFAPSPPPGSAQLSRNQDIPRPFVFRAPDTRQTRFERGERFEFGLVLIGSAVDFLPYFVLSFRELAAEGLGVNRAKCVLERVEQVKPRAAPPLAVAPPPSAVQSEAEVAPASSRLSARPSSGAPMLPLPERPHATQAVPPTQAAKSSSADSENNPPEVIYTAEDQLFRPAQLTTAADWMKSRLAELAPGGSAGRQPGEFRELAYGGSTGLQPGEFQPQKESGAPAPEFTAGELRTENRELRTDIHRITIRFLTPTLLRADAEVIRRPEFHHVFKRVRDRLNSLCTFFGEGPLEADFRELGRRAEHVRTVSCEVDWAERFRTSTRTRQRHELSGIVGEATYEGDLTEFLAWLLLSELVHVGKHTAWGCGMIRVGTLDLNLNRD